MMKQKKNHKPRKDKPEGVTSKREASEPGMSNREKEKKENTQHRIEKSPRPKSKKPRRVLLHYPMSSCSSSDNSSKKLKPVILALLAYEPAE